MALPAAGGAYFLFDLPGQAELFMMHDNLKAIISTITKVCGRRCSLEPHSCCQHAHICAHTCTRTHMRPRTHAPTPTQEWHYRLTAVHLVDAHLCTEASKCVCTLLPCPRSSAVCAQRRAMHALATGPDTHARACARILSLLAGPPPRPAAGAPHPRPPIPITTIITLPPPHTLRFISCLLLSLGTMLHLELPHVNVLSKLDLVRQYGRLGACGRGTVYGPRAGPCMAQMERKALRSCLQMQRASVQQGVCAACSGWRGVAAPACGPCVPGSH